MHDLSRHDDCRYWGLTWVQCGRYHARVSRFWADRARERADKAIALANCASWWARFTLVMVAGAVLFRALIELRAGRHG